MAKLTNDEIVIDKRFYAPPFVIDVRQEGEEDGSMDYQVSDVASDGPVLQNPGDGSSGGTNIPMPPTTFAVTSERVRITSDGRAVVDLEIEFPDVPGIETIDVGKTAL
jgi:hypothetical protein